jgi:hypothetical protein
MPSKEPSANDQVDSALLSSPLPVTMHHLAVTLAQELQKAKEHPDEVDSCVKQAAACIATVLTAPGADQHEDRLTSISAAAFGLAVEGTGFQCVHKYFLSDTGKNIHSDFAAVRPQTGSIIAFGEAKMTNAELDKATGQVSNEAQRCIYRRANQDQNYAPLLNINWSPYRLDVNLVVPGRMGVAADAWASKSSKKRLSAPSASLAVVPEDAGDAAVAAADHSLTWIRIASCQPTEVSAVLHVLRFWAKSGCHSEHIQMRKSPLTGAALAVPLGDNIAIYVYEGRRVCIKEFTYFRRENVVAENRRLPPPNRLLLGLHAKFPTAGYKDWKVQKLLPDTHLLVYNEIHGVHVPVSPRQWMRLLEIVEAVHELGYVHGDLLPRNMLFAPREPEAWLIDFDLSRPEGQPYVLGYNTNFEERHREARPGQPMMKVHDVHSLACLTKQFFDFEVSSATETVAGLREAFQAALMSPEAVEVRKDLPIVVGLASNSPNRAQAQT